ncbi:hypothetical protein [Formosa algae]|uniref:50S ribosomal protein L27 n=1 Tax=Formosa algae TaxID=225843 RepID=A0A9X0YKL6_9FLAO|nr:hypothetical protein [Formosa algae]MBP1840311.1 hypothetical protein [Formosa algae]MDQ0334175.1 hypothetical protein [Formosa algae]OEI79498.1 hypothetical protein AST99_14900 [Formosa algae]PNW29517.1 hypothetical protein BKP44_04105 [Formosa algae]
MYSTILNLHSYWAFLVLAVLTIATINSIVKFVGKKEYGPKDFRLALFTIIVSHIQLLIGIILYVVSPRLSLFSELGMGGVMKDATSRLYLVEHPVINIIALVFITMGYSKHKAKLSSNAKFKTISIFYTIGLILLLSRIPWHMWLGI